MEIIRHKTQKMIVMAMLAIMIMSIVTPVFATTIYTDSITIGDKLNRGEGLVTENVKMGEEGALGKIFDAISNLFKRFIEMFKDIDIPIGPTDTYYNFPQKVGEFYITTPWTDITEEQQRNNMNEIINIFRNNSSYNDAVIAGVLGNARCESWYNPNKKTMDTNGYYSHGIWQNNEAGRYTDLVNFCNKNGYTATSLKGQTMFVIHCMESGGVGNYSNISNTADGAQTAADLFRKEYEVSSAGKTDRKTAAKHIFNIMQR